MEVSSRNYRRTKKNGEARIMDDMYSLTIDWSTPVMVAFLAMVGLGFWSYLCWESLRDK